MLKSRGVNKILRGEQRFRGRRPQVKNGFIIRLANNYHPGRPRSFARFQFQSDFCGSLRALFAFKRNVKPPRARASDERLERQNDAGNRGRSLGG